MATVAEDWDFKTENMYSKNGKLDGNAELYCRIGTQALQRPSDIKCDAHRPPCRELGGASGCPTKCFALPTDARSMELASRPTSVCQYLLTMMWHPGKIRPWQRH